jgi:hypothetical protein
LQASSNASFFRVVSRDGREEWSLNPLMRMRVWFFGNGESGLLRNPRREQECG